MSSPTIEIEEGDDYVTVTKTYTTRTIDKCPHCGHEVGADDLVGEVVVETEDGDVPLDEFRQDIEYERTR